MTKIIPFNKPKKKTTAKKTTERWDMVLKEVCLK